MHPVLLTLFNREYVLTYCQTTIEGLNTKRTHTFWTEWLKLNEMVKKELVFI